MKTDDYSFSKYILADAASPRIAAECFAQNARELGVELSKLQSSVLLVLRYDDVIQVHGLASVVEEMASDLERLAGALAEFGCGDHAAELSAVVQYLGDRPRDDASAIAEFVREHGDFDTATLRITQDVEKVRRCVLNALSTTAVQL